MISGFIYFLLTFNLDLASNFARQPTKCMGIAGKHDIHARHSIMYFLNCLVKNDVNPTLCQYDDPVIHSVALTTDGRLIPPQFGANDPLYYKCCHTDELSYSRHSVAFSLCRRSCMHCFLIGHWFHCLKISTHRNKSAES